MTPYSDKKNQRCPAIESTAESITPDGINSQNFAGSKSETGYRPDLARNAYAAVIGESSIWASGGNKLGPGGKPESTLCSRSLGADGSDVRCSNGEIRFTQTGAKPRELFTPMELRA